VDTYMLCFFGQDFTSSENQLITHARFQDLGFRTSIFGSQDLGFRTSTRGFRTWLSGPGFQALNAKFQVLALRTWVSGPQREVSGPGSQDLGFRPSVFRSQDLGFRTSKALHPTVVLSFSHHFSLRPVVTDRRTDGLREFIQDDDASSGHRQTHGRTT